MGIASDEAFGSMMVSIRRLLPELDESASLADQVRFLKGQIDALQQAQNDDRDLLMRQMTTAESRAGQADRQLREEADRAAEAARVRGMAAMRYEVVGFFLVLVGSILLSGAGSILDAFK